MHDFTTDVYKINIKNNIKYEIFNNFIIIPTVCIAVCYVFPRSRIFIPNFGQYYTVCW